MSGESRVRKLSRRLAPLLRLKVEQLFADLKRFLLIVAHLDIGAVSSQQAYDLFLAIDRINTYHQELCVGGNFA